MSGHGYFVGCNQNVDIGYSKWALNKDVQKCPKCRMGIEKADGCNHMTCSSCRYEFCWICKGPYTDSHFEVWNIFGCPGAQYTPRFCRCPSCFPRWMNRIMIILCFLAVVVPLVYVYPSVSVSSPSIRVRSNLVCFQCSDAQVRCRNSLGRVVVCSFLCALRLQMRTRSM